MNLTATTIARLLQPFKCLQMATLAAIGLASFANAGAAMGEAGRTNTSNPLFELCNRSILTKLSPEKAAQLSEEFANKGRVEDAAIYAFSAFCDFLRHSQTKPRLLELAANAAERLLEADKSHIAYEILAAPEIAQNLVKDAVTPDLLRLRMSAARSLSFQDRNLEALKSREDIQVAIESTFGEFSPEAIENQLRVANLRLESGEVSLGLSLINRLADIAMRRSSLKARIRFAIFESQALALASSGNESDALKKLQSIKALLKTTGGIGTTREVDIDEEIAAVLLRSEDYEEALVEQSSVYLRRQRDFPGQTVRLQRSLWRLGFVYMSTRRLDAAEAIFLDLQLKLENVSTDQSKLLLWQTLSRLANIDARKGKFNEASEKWKAVVEREREALGAGSLEALIEEANFANALSHVGDTSNACNRLSNVLQQQQEKHPDDLWVNEFTRISLGRCLLQKGRLQDLENARALLLASLSHLANGNRGTGVHALYAIAAAAKADLLLNRRDEAKALLSKLIELSESSRRRVSPGLATRDDTFFTWIDGLSINGEEVLGYRELALLHAQDNDLEQALRVSELARDRTLGDQFAEQEWLRGKLPAADRAALEPLLERIQDLDERLAVVPDLMERVRLESQRTIAVAQRGRLERAMRARLHLPEPDSPPATLAQLRERLGAGTALVTVMHSGETWWALVVSRDGPARYVEIADMDLGRVASAWVRRLRGEPVRAWPLPDGRLVVDDLRPSAAVGPFLTTAQLGLRLSTALLGPIAAAATEARRLVFVGDDELVGVPLQALPLDGSLAIDRYDISYAPSLTTYARGQHRPARAWTHDLLAIGAIAYPRRTGPAADDTAAIGLEYAADHPLPRTGSEVAAIAAHFPPGRRRLLLGEAARKGWLRTASRSGELAGYRHVHLATHAWADPERPEASAVVLASGGSEPPLQVILTAAELAGLRMDADLIVLSACDTGAGHYEHGRGLLGLAYAALAAGNRAAVLSLWSIDDETTAPFMARFYENLAGGRDPVTALAAVQREFRQSADPHLADPAAWAPFLLYGGY